MKTIRLFAGLLMLLVGPPVAAHGSALPGRFLEATSVIVGRVWVDANDNGQFDRGEQPLPNVLVTLDQNGNVVNETRTNAEGAYRFDGLGAGSYTVTMVDDTLPENLRDGKNIVFQQVIPDNDEDYTIDKNFRIIGVPLKVTGQVLDNRRQPLRGVTVRLLRTNGEEYLTTQTDSQGRYDFPSDRIDGNEWVVAVASGPPGYTPASPERVPIALSLANPEAAVNFGFAPTPPPAAEPPPTTTPALPTEPPPTTPETPVAEPPPTPPDTARAAPPTAPDTPATEPPPPDDGAFPWLYALIAVALLGGAFVLWRTLHTRSQPSVVPVNWLNNFLAARDVKDWAKMYETLQEMPASLAQTPVVRQQHAFALNRDGRGDEAERVLNDLLEEEGPSPETNGILGRVYKDRFIAARKADQASQASELLDQAVETYLAGHDADPSNPYPGLNALTLMAFYPEPPSRRGALLQQVVDAAKARSQENQYWDHATRLELALLADDEGDVRAALADAVTAKRTPWEIETTLYNLRLLRTALEERGVAVPDWLGEVEGALERAMGSD